MTSYFLRICGHCTLIKYEREIVQINEKCSRKTLHLFYIGVVIYMFPEYNMNAINIWHNVGCVNLVGFMIDVENVRINYCPSA